MISVKTKQEIEIMRQGGRILAEVLVEVAKNAKPGVTTAFLDDLAEQLIFKAGALPAFKNFGGYPSNLCASVNEQVVHGVPSKNKILKEGEIISLDLGVLWPPEKCDSCPMASAGCGNQKGMYTDMAITVGVGKIDSEAKHLIEVARGALNVAVDLVKPGQKLSKISQAIQNFVEKAGFQVICDLVGHGVGHELHEDPQIPNFASRNFKEVILKEGMTLAIEPMAAVSDSRVKQSKDGYGWETKGGSWAAHFEHTVAVTKNGHEVLTKI